MFVRTGQLQPSYGENKEELPPNDMPEPRGIAFTIRAFVDSDHAGDVSTRRSRTGFIIMLNSAPIYWFSKKQTCVEFLWIRIHSHETMLRVPERITIQT